MTQHSSAGRDAVVVHDHFSMPGGGERTALALRAALDADLWTGFVCGAPALRLVAADRDRLHTLLGCLPVPLARTLLLSLLMPRIPLDEYELAMLSGNSAVCALLGRRAATSVLYCHAPPRYLFDQRDLFRRRVPLLLRPLADAMLREFERRYRAALERCDAIFVNSNTVRERVQRYFGRDATVLHPPVDTSALRWLADGDYFVSTARVAPLKRVEAIVRAFMRLPQRRLIVLSGGPDAQRLRRLAAGASNIVFTGWVPDRVRNELIGRCRATVYVPVDEDFGLSPIESMAAGKPVIGVCEGGLRETVLHERTGWLLDPDFTADDLRDAVEAMTGPRARAMRPACEARAQEFSMPRFRLQLADALAGLRPAPATHAAVPLVVRTTAAAAIPAMKVLHVYKRFYPDRYGGVERMIHQLVAASESQGVRNTVMSIALSDPWVADMPPGLQTIRLPQTFELASTPFSLHALARFRSISRGFDLLHFHYPWPFGDLLALLRAAQMPYVVTYHSDIVRQKRLETLYAPLRDRFLSAAAAIVATSANYLETSATLQRLQHKVVVIPIGLDPSHYTAPEPDRVAHWRARLGERFFLFVGVLRYYKGLHILMAANARLDLPVVIVGAGPIEAELRQQAATLGLRNTVFLGTLPEADKAALLKLAHALVFPSHLRSEAFGISLLEGALYGKPLISSELGTGSSFINIDGVTGMLVPPSDPIALRTALLRLWNDDRLCARLGAQAQKRFFRLFAADRMAVGYAQLYRDVLVESGQWVGANVPLPTT